jgi:hypothetical protein
VYIERVHAGGNANKETITVVPIICADGKEPCPPWVICKGAFNPDRPERSPDWVLTDDLQAVIKGTSRSTPFEHSPFYKQDSAYMNNAIFLHAFKYHFLPNVKHLLQLLKGCLLLLTDRYLAHTQLGVAQAAADAGVDIITFAPHSTHVAFDYCILQCSWEMALGH